MGEDLSLTDTQRSRNAAELAARQAQAQALATDIRSRAAQLLAADSEVGAKLTATAGDVGSLNFNEKPIAHDGKIQPVDWKQAPAPTPSPGPYGPRRPQRDQKSSEGHQGPFIGEIRSEQDLRNLWDWAYRRFDTGAPGATTQEQSGCYVTAPSHRDTRTVTSHGPTMEIRTPDKVIYEKIHVNAARGGVPEIPTRTAGPPEGAAPEQHAPAESAPVEDAPAERGPRTAPAAPEPSAPMGPAGSNPFPHFVEPPHSHHGPPIVGRNDLSDPEFESP